VREVLWGNEHIPVPPPSPFIAHRVKRALEEEVKREEGELQRLSKHSVEAHGGRIVKYIGDAVLTVFDSADAAVRSALKLQEGFTALVTHDYVRRTSPGLRRLT
jgi:class 3 adenylate cyclase